MAHTAVADGFHKIFDVTAPVDQLGTGFIFTEGPLWHPVEQTLIFSDMPGDVRRKYTPGRGISEIARPSNKGNGMTYDAELNLLVCEHATSSVVRIRPDGRRETLCTHFEGRELNSPNDIIAGRDGSIYFTDPTFGRLEHFGVPRPLQMSRNWLSTATCLANPTDYASRRVSAGCGSTTLIRPISECSMSRPMEA